MNEQNAMNLRRIMKVSKDRELPANTVHMLDAVEDMAVMEGQAIPITGQVLLMIAAVTTIFYDGNVVPTEMYDVTKDDEDTVTASDKKTKEVGETTCTIEWNGEECDAIVFDDQRGVEEGYTRIALVVPNSLISLFGVLANPESKEPESEEPKEPRETEPQKCEVFYEGQTHQAVIEERATTEAGMVSVIIEGETAPTLVNENDVNFIDEEVKDE